MPPVYLDALVDWVARRRRDLESLGVMVSLSRRTETDKPATVIVWVSGECEVEVGSDPQTFTSEHHDLESEEALDSVLESTLKRLFT
jgi:hypothetical protein